MRHTRLQRITALLLSWALPANSVWPSMAMAAAAGPAWAAGSRAAGGSWEPVADASAFESPDIEPAPPEAAPAFEPQSGGGDEGGSLTIFGPKKYVRTAGPTNEYVDTVVVPPGATSPFTMHVQNGEADGSNRVSSAWIYVNGSQVAAPADFNQNVFTFDRSVTLTPTTTLK